MILSVLGQVRQQKKEKTNLSHVVGYVGDGDVEMCR